MWVSQNRRKFRFEGANRGRIRQDQIKPLHHLRRKILRGIPLRPFPRHDDPMQLGNVASVCRIACLEPTLANVAPELLAQNA